MATGTKSHKDWLKIGTSVLCKHPRGARFKGRVDGNDIERNGLWIAVNISPKGANRVLKYFRRKWLTVV